MVNLSPSPRCLFLIAALLCLPHSASTQALIIGGGAGIGRFHGVTTEPGMPTCNVQVSEECRRLMAERRRLMAERKAWAARMRLNAPRRPAR
jgi:hypothetical protein